GSAVQAGSRVDAGAPQPAQVALAVSPVAVSIPEAFQHGLIGAPEKARTGAELPLGHFQYFFMMLAPVWASLYTSHNFSLLRTPGRRWDGCLSLPYSFVHPSADL